MEENRRQPVIDVLCEGNARSVGELLGTGLMERIGQAVASLYDYEAFRLEQPWWMPYYCYRYLAEWRAREILEQSIRASSPHMAERLEGMAEAAGVRIDSLYLFHALEVMATTAEGMAIASPLAACTAVALPAGRSATGEAILHHNFDNVPLARPLLTLRDRREQGKFRCLEFTIAPLAGVIDGMNERGLCITYNFAWTTTPGPPAPPVSMAISDALDRCTTVAEAARFIQSSPLWGGSMLMLADADGDVAQLELAGRHTRLTRPGNGSNALLHSNTYRSAAMKPHEVSRDTCFGQNAPRGLRGCRALASAEERDVRLEEEFLRGDVYTAEDLAAVMADHGEEDTPGDNTVCMHGPHWQTLASLQFLPRSRALRIAYGFACEASYSEIQL